MTAPSDEARAVAEVAYMDLMTRSVDHANAADEAHDVGIIALALQDYGDQRVKAERERIETIQSPLPSRDELSAGWLQILLKARAEDLAYDCDDAAGMCVEAMWAGCMRWLLKQDAHYLAGWIVELDGRVSAGLKNSEEAK